MGRIDVGVKCIQVRSLIEKRAYQEACQVAETIDIDKVTSIVDLKVIASVYERLGRYDEAKDILLRSYERKPTKMVIYRLAYLSVKTKEFEDAEFFYQEFSNMAPNSPDRYILRYGIDRAKGVDYYLRIATLQRLKQICYMEEWGYELAKVYHKAGLYEECIQECRDLITWFGSGVIVEKARMLCQYHEHGKEALDAYGVFDEDLSPEELVSRREQFISDTQDLRSQTVRIQQEQEKREIRKRLDRDLEKTVDLRQILEEEGEDLDLLKQAVHRVWGAPASEEPGQVKPKRTYPEPVGEMREVKVPQTPEEVIAASLAEVLTEEEKGNEPENFHIQDERVEFGLEEVFEETEMEVENIPEYNEEVGSETTTDSMEEAENNSVDLTDDEQNDSEEIITETEEDKPEEIITEAEENKPEEIITEAEEDKPEEIITEAEEDRPEEIITEAEEDRPEEIITEAEGDKTEEIITEVEEDKTEDEKEIPQNTLKENMELPEEETEIPAYVQRERAEKEGEDIPEQKEEKKSFGKKRGLKQFFAKRKKKKVVKEKDKENKNTVKKQKKNKKETVDKFDETEPLEFVGEPYVVKKADDLSTDTESEKENTEYANTSSMTEEPANIEEAAGTNIAEEFDETENTEEVAIAEEAGETEDTEAVIAEESDGTEDTEAVIAEESDETENTEAVIAEESDETENTEAVIAEESDEIEDTEEEIFMSVCGVDLWKYFSAYKQDTRLCQDIDAAFRRMQSGKTPYHMMITCKDQKRATKLGKEMAKVMKKLGFTKEQQVARVTAEELNRMHLEQSYETLEGKFLLVEQAKKITADTAQSIMNMINERRNHIVVILTDARPYMDDLMNEYKMMRRYFPNDLKMK